MTTTNESSPTDRHVVPIEEAIAEIRAGRMIILMDDEDRENEGDLCMAAEKVTPEAINFMARFGRGLICLPVTEEKASDLGLEVMTHENRSPLGTNFTVSIDARRGITHGQSAADRAATILAAIREGATPRDVITPGHIFPLIARKGGVLFRTGQTEGSVDMARLAGLAPAGVICEIMREDGTMARLDDLGEFAREHSLKIATVADLIQYRLRNDSLVERIAEAELPSRYGSFRAIVFRSRVDGAEHLCLVKGEIHADVPTLVRAHSEYLPGDVFRSKTRDTGAILHKALERIEAEGSGIVLYLQRETVSESEAMSHDDTAERPSTTSGQRMSMFRDYGIGAQILRSVGAGKVRLLTNSQPKLVSFRGYGLEITETVPLSVTEDDKVVPIR